MPYLQLDVPRHYSSESKRRFARRIGSAYAEIMQTTPNKVAVAIRELGDGGLWRCGDEQPEPAAVFSCDIRSGRPPAQRARLAEAIVAICVEDLGLTASQLSVEFTQHPGDEIFRPGRGLVSDWTAAEAR